MDYRPPETPILETPVTASFNVSWLIGNASSYGDSRNLEILRFPNVSAPFHMEFGLVRENDHHTIYVDLSSITLPHFPELGSPNALAWEMRLVEGRCSNLCDTRASFNLSIFFSYGKFYERNMSTCPQFNFSQSTISRSSFAIINLVSNHTNFLAMEVYPKPGINTLCSRQGEILSISDDDVQGNPFDIPLVAPVVLTGFLLARETDVWVLRFPYSSVWNFGVDSDPPIQAYFGNDTGPDFVGHEFGFTHP
eukprot:TRINITY_DN8670_c0_g1_i1.p1 TRINITY_DN8670_c0_g1~~TRINITY_DN8670_c0_g1_i1.p1  ORF type:complete len:251 (-),score=41.11 TRINITY_DN8670_c0_g1_i1:567-1319(-)